MNLSWSVRIYKEDDELGILDLMKVSGFKRTTDSARALWSWEYKNNPFGYCIGVADHNGQLVGHMALIPVPMKIGEKAVMGAQAVDLVVHPRFRRQGIFLAIGKFLIKEAKKQGIDLLYGFPNKLAHSGHLKYGWFDIYKVPVLVKPLNVNNIADSLSKYGMIRVLNRNRISRIAMKYILQSILMIIEFFSRKFNRVKGSISDELEIHNVESFDDRISEFWKEVCNDYPIAVIRSKEYLNWRYSKKPDAKYTILLAEEKKKILGFIVLLDRKEENLRVGYIADILAPLNKEEVIRSLMLKGVRQLVQKNVDLIICWMSKDNSSAHVYYRILRHNGFIPFIGRLIPLIVQVNSPQLLGTFVGDPTKWYITAGDSDHI